MIYRLLLSAVKLIDDNLKYRFAYWWSGVYCFLNRFNPIALTLPSNPVNIMNLDFPNPVGLAAGFDRDGKLAYRLNTAGFGFIEIGTINIDSEIESDNDINNIIHDIEQSKNHCTNQALLGVSIGSLRNSIDDHTVADYLYGMEKFWNHSDYIVINLSRPGSSMRSEIHKNAALRRLLEKIKQRHAELCNNYRNHVPIVVKVAIDYETRKTLPETLTVAYELGFDGLLIAFENWPSSTDVKETVSWISTLTNKLPLIVVGGIKSENDVMQILNSGANLVQCYSLLVNQGPLQTRKMIAGLGKFK
jgi:dihydroorotate dehydrogenase